MAKSSWTKKNLELMHALRSEGKTWDKISKEIKGKSANACQRKHSRTNWESYLEEGESDDPISRRGIWKRDEMVRLHAFLTADKSYPFIAEQLKRSATSVERKAQQTNWKSWLETFSKEGNGQKDEQSEEEIIKRLTHAMVEVSQHDYKRIQKMRKGYFCEKINIEEKYIPVPFADIKKLATQELDGQGLGNEETIQLDEGTYIIVGDSHGKHTNKEMFNLIKRANDYFDADNVIHIGHILDDDNEISFKWGDIDNLIVIAKPEELKVVHRKRNAHNFSYDVVTSSINAGNDLVIANQELIGDYVKTPIKNLDSHIFGGKMVVNCHRMETSSKGASDGESHYMTSPGSICDNHIVRTIKQIDFLDGKQIKMSLPSGYLKYRKMVHHYEYWTQGMLVLHVDSEGEHTLVPCLIREQNNVYYTSYFDKIISSKGIHEPDKKILVSADMHCPKHDSNILDIQEQVCKDYKPDTMVNIGDAFDVSALSHHDIDKGVVIFGDYLSEAAKTYYIAKRMANWAPELHMIIGNHERFILDFVKKFPQLSSILDFEFVCDLEALGYSITGLKEVLEIGDTKFIHGDMIFFNQTGSKQEKASRALGSNIFIGHIHYPSIRFSCYSVGFAGKMDQGYNEPEASAWIHGMGFCNQYKGMSWPTTVAIFNNTLVINGKTYKPVDPDSWDLQDFKARIVYDIIDDKKSDS